MLKNIFRQGRRGMAKGFFLLFLPVLFWSVSGCQPFGKKSEETSLRKDPCVVLALPASGPYAPVAEKIKRGASMAVAELKKIGFAPRVENINTEASNWLSQLEALPPYCAIVGGPLQEKAYLAARSAKSLEKRAFFSFLPNLRQGDEGKLAWRFFPSPGDQIEALVKFGTKDLDMRSYGAFYPNDSYGKRMTELFEKSLAFRHIPFTKASYNPGAPATWSEAAQKLINPTLAEDGKTPIPQTTFGAVFLPDSWKHIDGVTQSLIYNGEDRLALFGTALWEQGLAGKQIPKANKYALAVFPAAWSKSRAHKALQGPDSDFWTALGFDFINFAVNAGINERLSPEQVASRAQRAASAIRSVAPMRWDANGVGSQELFLFQVGPSGMTPLNLEKFKKSLVQAHENAALRMQGSSAEPEIEQAAPVQQARPAPAQNSGEIKAPAPAPRPAVMTPEAPPVSSYKLRLPVKQ